jgi:hypothetical protein
MENETSDSKKKLSVANFDPTKNPITTGMGLITFVLALAMGAYMFFNPKPEVIKLWYIPTIVGSIGILLVLSPDTLVYGAKKGIDKVTEGKDKPTT